MFLRPLACRHNSATRRANLAIRFDDVLLAVVVGSGIMGERLAAGNNAIALLANSLATGCGLYVLMTIFEPLPDVGLLAA